VIGDRRIRIWVVGRDVHSLAFGADKWVRFLFFPHGGPRLRTWIRTLNVV
jgi:hypothetical protein